MTMAQFIDVLTYEYEEELTPEEIAYYNSDEYLEEEAYWSGNDNGLPDEIPFN